MLIFNALTRLQAGLFSVLAAAAPAQPVEELVDDDEAAVSEVSEDDADFTDETQPRDDPRWECWDWGEVEKRGHCLARCDHQRGYRAVTDRIRVRGNRDYCHHRARRYCQRRGDRLENWCFGERD